MHLTHMLKRINSTLAKKNERDDKYVQKWYFYHHIGSCFTIIIIILEAEGLSYITPRPFLLLFITLN